MEHKTMVVTRMAPSPTGLFHVGSIRTTLYNYLYARKHGGKFILRCEDTDVVRSKKEYEEYFLEVLAWLGLEFDEYYRQSERTEIYKNYLERLISEDKAYISKEEPKKEGDRTEVIRFRNPGKKVTFHDEVLGDITFDTTELGDFVIARDLESPLYHFTVVVDDFEMGVTHIIRGSDHVSNTPRHILIQEAIGAPRPIYAHASTILNEERARLSKRDPAVRPSLEYRDEGYLPGAILNFMALIGWNPGTEKEIFTLQELIQEFTLERMQKQGAAFKSEKLEWVNREHIKMMGEEERLVMLKAHIPTTITALSGYSEEKLMAIAPLIFERISHFGQVKELVAQGELTYFFERPIYDAAGLLWKKDPDAEKTKRHLDAVMNILSEMKDEEMLEHIIKDTLFAYADREGRGDVLWPTRYALSGKDRSPDPVTLILVLGREESIERLSYAITLLDE